MNQFRALNAHVPTMPSVFAITFAIVMLSGTLTSFASQNTGDQIADPDPQNTTGPIGSFASAKLQQYLKDHDYRDAEAWLIEQINRDPASPRARQLLIFAGHIYFEDKSYLNAAIAWSKADRLAPLDDANRFTLAMADIELHRPDWARLELANLARAKPKVALYQYWLGRLDYDGHEYDSAISRLKGAIRLDPHMTRAYDRLGLCYDYVGQSSQAMQAFQKAVALNRQQPRPSPWPNLDFAITLTKENQPVKAEEELREALSYDPVLPQAHYRLGLVLAEQGHPNEAILSLKRAATLDPAYAEPHYALARLYRRVGRKGLAKKEAQIFQSLNEKNNAPSVDKTR